MIQLQVNGVDRSSSGDAEMRLLWYLRDIRGLTGTKLGCGIALCGSVHNNGEAIRSCITPMNSVASTNTTTIEGIGADGLRPVQQAWIRQ